MEFNDAHGSKGEFHHCNTTRNMIIATNRNYEFLASTMVVCGHLRESVCLSVYTKLLHLTVIRQQFSPNFSISLIYSSLYQLA